MRQQLTFGEQMELALAEASENMADPAIVNSGLAWIPNLSMLLVVIALIATIAVIWISHRAEFRSKVTKTVTSVAWASASIALLALLSSFSSSESVTGASPMFVIASVSAAFLGISALASRTRNLFYPEDMASASPDATRSLPNPSAFWGPVVKTTISVTLDDGKDGGDPISSSVVSRSHGRTPASRTRSSALREVRSSGYGSLAYRIFSEAMGWLIPLLAIAGASALCFAFLEIPSNPSFLSIPEPYMACELSTIACAVAGSWLVFQRRPIGFVVPLLASALYGIAECFVESFKSAAMMPSDLRSAGTGMAVAGSYEYELTTSILLVISMFCIAAGCIAWLRDPLSGALARREYEVGDRWKDKFLSRIAAKRQRRSDVACLAKNAIVAIVSVILGIQIALAPISPAMETNWEEEGIVFDYWDTGTSIDSFGIIPSLIAALQLEDLEAPEGYDRESASELQSSMASLYDEFVSSSASYKEAASQFESEKPNVLLVMNESFADLSYLDGLGVGYEGLPYESNLDAIGRGKASVSVYGGGTCNSEFEALTGISLGYVGGGISPYALYDLSHVDSIPKQFKALGYDTTAMHPESATNWGRDKVYPELGFDEFVTEDSFEDAERLRDNVRDYETYDAAIDRIVDGDAPQFIFDLTMSNHGGYESGLIPDELAVDYDFDGMGVSDEHGDAVINEYLSSVRMSDYDAQYLVSKLSEIDEPTVVVFFGDHHPGFSWWFQDDQDTGTDNISYQEAMYQTDWFVWANYPISGSDWNPRTVASEDMEGSVSSFDALTAGETTSYGNDDEDARFEYDDSDALGTPGNEGTREYENMFGSDNEFERNASSRGADSNESMGEDEDYSSDSNAIAEESMSANAGSLLPDRRTSAASSDAPSIIRTSTRDVIDMIEDALARSQDGVGEAPEEEAPQDDWSSFLGPIDVVSRQALGIDGSISSGSSDSPSAAQLAEPSDDWYPELGGGSTLYSGTMSPADLMGWAMTFIGAPLTDYEKASYMSRWWLQSNNIYGYMDASGTWYPMESADLVAGAGTYEEGMRIIEEASVSGLPDAVELSGEDGDASRLVEDEEGTGTRTVLDNEEAKVGTGYLEDVYEDDDSISESEVEEGVLGGESDDPGTAQAREARAHQDAVMVNVMKWITYMNFAELLR